MAKKIKNTLTKSQIKVSGKKTFPKFYLNYFKKAFNKLLDKLSGILVGLRTIVSNLVILGGILLLCIITYSEITTKSIIIEPFEVSKELQDKGYNGKVISNKLMDKLNSIKIKARKLKSDVKKHGEGTDKKSYISTSFSPQQMNNRSIEVPGTGVSLDIIFRYLKDLIKNKPTHITGEIIINNNKVYINTRIDGKPAETFNADSDKDLQNLDEILLKSAKHIYKDIEPITLAFYLYKERNVKECLDIAIHITSNIPNNPSKREKNDVSMAYNIWGVVLFEQRKYDEAIGVYKKAIEIDPKYVFAYNDWAGTLREQQKYDEAIAIYKKAIEIDPKYVFAYYDWADTLREQQKYDEAIAIYKKAIEINPKYVFAYNGWAGTLREQQKYDEAIGVYKKAIEINPKYDFMKDKINQLEKLLRNKKKS